MPGSAQCAVAITTSTASTIYRMCRYVFGSLLLSSSSSSLMASNLSLNPLTARHTLGKRRPHRNEMSSLWESRVPRPPIMQYSITGNNGLRRPLTLTTLWADILVHFTTQLLILWSLECYSAQDYSAVYALLSFSFMDVLVYCCFLVFIYKINNNY